MRKHGRICLMVYSVRKTAVQFALPVINAVVRNVFSIMAPFYDLAETCGRL